LYNRGDSAKAMQAHREEVSRKLRLGSCRRCDRLRAIGLSRFVYSHLPVTLHVNQNLLDSAWPADFDALNNLLCAQAKVQPWIA
jgi:hypothetical protein